jgi:3-hydroxybutyrate dehydrogenase
MLKDTVDGEFTTTDDVAEAVLFFAAASSKVYTGQSLGEPRLVRAVVQTA